MSSHVGISFSAWCSRAFWAVLPVLVVFSGVFSGDALGADDEFFPEEIRDIQVGISSAELVAKIQNTGRHSVGESPGYRNRQRITWVPAANPYFEEIRFDFTEKDRLFLVSFALREGLADRERALRKSFMEKLQVQGNPVDLTVVGKKMKVHECGAGPYHFIEMTELANNRKFLEIFGRHISAEDKPPIDAQRRKPEASQQ